MGREYDIEGNREGERVRVNRQIKFLGAIYLHGWRGNMAVMMSSAPAIAETRRPRGQMPHYRQGPPLVKYNRPIPSLRRQAVQKWK